MIFILVPLPKAPDQAAGDVEEAAEAVVEEAAVVAADAEGVVDEILSLRTEWIGHAVAYHRTM